MLGLLFDYIIIYNAFEQAFNWQLLTIVLTDYMIKATYFELVRFLIYY